MFRPLERNPSIGLESYGKFSYEAPWKKGFGSYKSNEIHVGRLDPNEF